MSTTHGRDDDTGSRDNSDRPRSRGEAAGVEIEAYEDEGQMVLFDSENPLAWVEANRTISLTDAT